MIKKLLFIGALTSAGISFAQTVQNAGFETWTNFGFYEEPQNWGTINALSVLSGGDAPVTKSTTAHSGTYSARMETVSIDFDGQTETVPGILTLGALNPFAEEPTTGVPFTARPDSLIFWYKYTPVTGDVAGVFGSLTRWNEIEGVREIIGEFNYIMTDPQAGFVRQGAGFNYESSETPDTLTITFLSSTEDPQIGSALWVDDVSFITTETVGLTKKPAVADIRLYPNPAKESITVVLEKEAVIEIYNVLGAHVATIRSNGTDKTVIPVESYNNGVYILKTSTGITQRFVVKH